MSQRANPTLIGLFIVIGVALGVTGLVLFSSSKLFSPTRKMVLYFHQTLNGLSEGAPVKYRGVTIGSVKQVMIHLNQRTNDYALPVIIQLDYKLLRQRLGGKSSAFFSSTSLDQRIQSGLRASLELESLVTGILFVDIRFHPNAPPPEFHQLEQLYPEIPTEPTQITQLMDNLTSLDVKSMETNLNAVVTKIGGILSEMHMADINAGITNALRSVERVVSSPEITNDLVAVRATLEPYRKLGEKLNNRVDPLVDSVTNSLGEATLALARIRGAAENARTLLAPDASFRNDLELALQQLANASESIAALVEFLRQHPNALISGRQTPKQKP
jgi:paraquat-inducible protein B